MPYKDPEKRRENDRKRYAANPEKGRERSRIRRDANPEKARERCRKWYSANAEKARERSRIRRASNPEKARECNRKWRAANLENARDLDRKWYAANTEKVRERSRMKYPENRRKHLLAKYKISTEKYSEMFFSQGGLCALCKKPETVKIRGVIRRLAVDHAHDSSSKVRGLLCGRCNTSIERMDTDPEWAIRALEYLGHI